MTTYYLGVRPFGDSLISLSLLHRLPDNVGDVRILSTPVLEQVAAVTGLLRFPMERVLPHIAAFFDVRVRGPLDALAELRALRLRLAQVLQAGDTLLVEQQDWRNRWLVPAGLPRAVAPRKATSVYLDRRALLQDYFGQPIPLPPSRGPARDLRSMMIHPGARQQARIFPPAVVANLLRYAAARGVSVCLVDADGSFASFGAQVHDYVREPPLEHAVAKLRNVDFFVGADSFFLHLAYFYDVPLFGIGDVPRPYFSPPEMLERGAALTIVEAGDAGRLERTLDRSIAS